jgi:hypothetical protein
MRLLRSLLLPVLMASLSCAAEGAAGGGASPEARAVAFLEREVPAWPVRNRCFSCHNNGDAARALFAARRRGLPVDPRSLEATAGWLARPEAWKDNDPREEFGDRKLAALQFASALAAAVEAGAPEGLPALGRAAEAVRDHQEADGSWKVDADGLPGSPITYGRTLATVVARRVLAAASASRFAAAIARADGWLKARRPQGVLDAAAILLGSAEAPEQRRHCLEVLRKGQSPDGGWGPFVTAPPEVFDTALALLALASLRDEPGVGEMAARGREFLVRSQLRDGSWPETTRPPGAESYAQRLSTTGWATLALLQPPP